jgi:fatty-acid desaturase
VWWEFDQSWITIKLLRSLGVIKKVQVASVDGKSAEREAA